MLAVLLVAAIGAQHLWAADEGIAAQALPDEAIDIDAGELLVFPNRRGTPVKIKVPYPPGEETVFPQHKYFEPGTSRVLHLAYTTPYEDDTLEGCKTYKMWYCVSLDGGNTYDKLRPLIQKGPGYDRFHPIRCVQVPKNSYVATVPPPTRASNGEIMVPFQYWPLDDQGELLQPANASWTFLYSGVLIGRWTADGKDVEWDLGDTVCLEPEQSTRGAFEPTIVELSKPGRFLMVLRGSNEGRTDLPGHKWMAVSDDYCRTWSKPEPLSYSDGTAFYSPSACSDLRRNSKTGKLYWIGNIAAENPSGNYPRFPLVIGEIDEDLLGLHRQSVAVIDTRDPEKDSVYLQLSNFNVREDPTSGRFVVELSRLDYGPGGTYLGRTWPTKRYEVPVETK